MDIKWAVFLISDFVFRNQLLVIHSMDRRFKPLEMIGIVIPLIFDGSNL